MPRLLIFTFLITLCQSLFGLTDSTEWFEKIENGQYRVVGENINPVALFRKLSVHSGIEVRYEKTLYEGIELELDSVSIDGIIRHIDSNFSTLKSYLKDQNGKEILSSLTVLPKGQFQSTELVVAYDPVQETVDFKKGKFLRSAEKVYVTRMQSLEIEVRKQLEELAEREVKRDENNVKRIKERQYRDQEEKRELVSELKVLKSSDPDLYKHKLNVMAWRYPGIKDAINESESSDSME